MKHAMIVLILLAATGTLFADTTAVTPEGKTVILKSDGTFQYADDAKQPKQIRYADEAVTIWKVSLQHFDKELSTGRYRDSVALTFDFENHTNKKVVGVAVLCIIKNPFGKELLNETYENEVVIQPNERMKNNLSWFMEDNQFIHDQPYDRLKVVAQNGTAKITTKVVKVVFEDGTVLNARKN